jgi:class 3 adenylate cyclase/outer membrane protein assembly factor BamB
VWIGHTDGTVTKVDPVTTRASTFALVDGTIRARSTRRGRASGSTWAARDRLGAQAHNRAVPRRGRSSDRRLVTVLFTDIAGSTERAAELGDTQWRRLLDAHNRTIRRLLKRHRGREIDTAGDGFFATFEQPAHAIDCALDLIETLRPIGVHIRAGVHMGEVEVLGPKVTGMSVHIGARLMSVAAADQVVVSSTVRDLMSGSELPFVDRGVQRLKGVDAEWHLYSVDGPAETRPELALPPQEPPSLWRRPIVLIVGAAVLALGVVAGVLLTRGGAEPTPTVNSVVLIDDTGDLIDVVPVGTGPSTIDADEDSLWVANGLDRTIQRVDLGTGTAEPAEGGLPRGPTSITTGDGLVWVGTSLQSEGSLTRIDPTQPNSAQTVDVGAPVNGLAFGLGALWATDRDGSQLIRLDPTTGEEIATNALPEGSEPTGIAISADAVWVALHGSSQVASVDPATGEVTTIPSAAGAPDQVAVGAGYVWVTVGDGDSVLRIDPATDSAFTIEAVGDGPTGIAASDRGVWVANQLDGSVARIDPASGDVVDRIDLGRDVSPRAVEITPEGVWVSLSSR